MLKRIQLLKNDVQQAARANSKQVGRHPVGAEHVFDERAIRERFGGRLYASSRFEADFGAIGHVANCSAHDERGAKRRVYGLFAGARL